MLFPRVYRARVSVSPCIYSPCTMYYRMRPCIIRHACDELLSCRLLLHCYPRHAAAYAEIVASSLKRQGGIVRQSGEQRNIFPELVLTLLPDYA